ncbi:MAG: PQQ-binding-like beta-propeller repeat protein [Cyclobacteriaceae bacterium]
MKKPFLFNVTRFGSWIVLIMLLISCQSNVDQFANTDWPAYLGSKSSAQYSTLTQITADNVSDLEIAWIYQPKGDSLGKRSQFSLNPIIVDEVLYGLSPNQKCFAVNAATGEELWSYDPFENEEEKFRGGIGRGVTYWSDGKNDERIFAPYKSFIYSLEAKTGKLIESFGDGGRIDLKNDLGRDVSNSFVAGFAPGVVYKNLLIQGTTVSESEKAAPGHIRAYDVLTGEKKWIFHTIPHPGEFGYETWGKDNWKSTGGANAWSGLTLDEKLGIVYVPLGSANYDFFGGDRPGDNLFANCLVALDATTGERIWHYQTVHHDIWDRDLPSPPNLVDLTIDGKEMKAIAQVTKTGFLFLLDRLTGEPIFEINEEPFPPSELETEFTNKTQPIPTKPEPFTRQYLDTTMLTQVSPEAHAFVKEQLLSMNYGNYFIPPSLKGTVIFPGLGGGGTWGGAAYDPDEGMLYINSNEIPYILQLAQIEVYQDQTTLEHGRGIYQQVCANCHGADLMGTDHMGAAPALLTIAERYDKSQLVRKIAIGGATMPPFFWMPENEIEAIAEYLLNYTSESQDVQRTTSGRADTIIYANMGYRKLLDHEGFPGITPPWGTVSAVDLAEGKVVWQKPLGYYPELAERYGLDNTGSELFGGPVLTASGLLFTAATKDHHMRAFDKKTGELLWKYELPAGGYATPAIYEADGKQFIVIACGSAKLESPADNKIVAFALP